MSLLSADGYTAATSVGAASFLGLFQYNYHIYSHDTKELVLPATMLADGCYSAMFYGCDALTRAPELPATTLADHCYESMFYGCSSLNSIICLATDITASDCTNNWLDGVAATGTFTAHDSSVGWTANSTSGIPSGWTRVNAE